MPKKKLSRLFVSSILVLGLSAGCSAPTLDGSTATPPSSASAGDQAAADGEASGGFRPTGYPIVDEPITIKVVHQRTVDTDRKSLGDIAYLQELEQKTNVHVDWDEIISTAWEEKVNLMFVSGDLPDAFLGEGLSDLNILANVEAFLPLNDLIEEYGTNIKDCFAREDALRKVVTAADGNIYSLFRYRGSYFPNTLDMVAINKTWLDTLGLEVPTTTDEYYAVLKAFQERDPNGNGKADEIPLILWHGLGNATNSESSFFPPFGVYDNTSYSELVYHMMVRDGQPVFTPAQDGYRQALEFLNKLYSEGLLDPEIYTMTQEQYMAKTQDPDDIVGSFVAWTPQNSVGTQRAEEDFVQLTPLIGPNGDQGYTVVNDVTIGRNMFSITTVNQYPEVTMRWIDEWYSEDMSIQTFYGPYGLMTDRNEDGTVTAHEPPEGITYGIWRWGNCPADSAPYACFPEFEQFLTPAQQQRDRDAFQKVVDPYLQKEIYPNVNFTLDQINDLRKIIPDLNSYVAIMRAQFVSDGITDAQWTEYLQQLDRLRLADAMEIYNDAYATFNS